MKKFLFCLFYVLTSTITANAQNNTEYDRWVKISSSSNKSGDKWKFTNEFCAIELYDDGSFKLTCNDELLDFSYFGYAVVGMRYFDSNGKIVDDTIELFEKVSDNCILYRPKKEDEKKFYECVVKQEGAVWFVPFISNGPSVGFFVLMF